MQEETRFVMKVSLPVTLFMLLIIAGGIIVTIDDLIFGIQYPSRLAKFGHLIFLTTWTLVFWILLNRIILSSYRRTKK